MELRHVGDRELALGFGGDTLNTALYVARIAGGRLAVDYVTALGDDRYSDDMAAAWRAEGVSTELVARLTSRLPGLYIIRTNDRGERSFTYFRSAAAARDMLRDGRDATIEAGLADHACLYLSGVTLSILDDGQRRILLDMLARLRRRGLRVAFDGNYRPAGWPEIAAARRWMTEMLGHCDIALPTFDDERRLFGDGDATATIRRMHGLGVGEIAVKLGGAGCLLSIEGAVTSVPTEVVAQPADTTAAGDAFNAAYMASRMLGRDPPTAARNGNLLAGVVIRHPGAIIPRAAMPELPLE